MADPVFTRHVTKLWPGLEELFATGEQVVELAESAGWGHIAAVLDAEIATITAKLEEAREPLTQAQYAQAHGRLDGLRGARRAADAIIRRYREELERQRQAHEDAGESVSGGS